MKKSGKFLVLAALLVLALVVAAGCSGSQPATTETKKPEAPKIVSLVEQVKASGHNGFFKEMAEGNKYPPARADACIECHSAVKRLDDHNAHESSKRQGERSA